MKYLISRHPSTLQIFKSSYSELDATLRHLNKDLIGSLKEGDEVFGNLPFKLVAHLNVIGVKYFNIDLELTEYKRGLELSVTDLNKCNLSIAQYEVKKL